MPSSDLTRLLRAPALSDRRQGRLRANRASIVWHDSAGGALAEQGLSLSQGANPSSPMNWRLERLRPVGYDWLPAHAPPLLAEDASPDALGHALPDGLAPVAAFYGMRRSMALGGEGACLTVLEGTLRGLTQDRPTCRLILRGEAMEMGALASRLAEAARLRVPRAGLAAEAIAVATGREPRPRHIGTPSVAAGASVGDALGLAVAHLADVILYWAALVPGAQSAEPVHQMRVALRRLRSVLAVFGRVAQPEPGQPSWLDELDAALQAVAARLGTARDWDVFLDETGVELSGAFGQDRRVGRLLAASGRRRAAIYAALPGSLEEVGWGRLQLTLGLLPTTRPWHADATVAQQLSLAAPIQPFAAQALQRRLKRVIAPGKSVAHLSPGALHDVRKQAKRLRYTAELFAPLFPVKPVRKYLDRLEHLQAALGTVNDAVVAAGLLVQLGGGADRAFAAGIVQGYGAGRGAESARRVARAWSKFYRATPFWD